MGSALTLETEGGVPLSILLADHPDAFRPEDVAIIEAGEASGRLEQTLERLALLEDQRRQARRSLLTEAWYPILLFHVAAVLLPVARNGFAGKLSFNRCLGDTLTILLPVYGLFVLLRALNRSPAWRQRMRRLAQRLPGFSAAARHRRRATFAGVLEAAYGAGITLDRGLSLAGRAAQLPEIEIETAAAAIAAGEALTPVLTRARIFSTTALSRIATGEKAGELSPTLYAIADEEAQQANAIFRRCMVTLGKIIYLFVALWIVWVVISFYVGYLSQFDDLDKLI